MPSQTRIELDAQYRQLRGGCGLLDRSARGKLLLRGAEAAEFLQGQVTNDVEALEPGEGCYAALLDRKANIRADMRVLRLAPDELWVDTEAQAAEATRRHLETYKIGREVEVVDETEARAILSLIGPATGAVAGTPTLPHHASAEVVVATVGCLAVGTAWGVDLIAEGPDGATPLADGLRAAGAGAG